MSTPTRQPAPAPRPGQPGQPPVKRAPRPAHKFTDWAMI